MGRSKRLADPDLPGRSLSPPDVAASSAEATARLPISLQESQKAAVQPVGELIKDFLAYAPDAVDYLRPYLRAPAPIVGMASNSG